MKSCVILANGDFPTHPIARNILNRANFVVCCDGAVNEFIAQGGKPDKIIGDLDSLHSDIKKKYRHRIISHPSQESNDLTKAINFFLYNNIFSFTLLGITGKRIDHTLGNLGILLKCSALPGAIKAYSNSERIIPISNKSQFSSFAGQQVSFVSSSPTCRIQTHGLRYPANNLQLKTWDKATLNEALGNTFSLKTTEKVLVIQKYK